ncbi:hypothetical protein ALC62_07795 [Cyphomyrmex costatus]|uniref:SAP domain-containing protein n=1 Tax=Cyphomyrmex costatus TaxID=456900 RepID=A0A151IHH1_9HYME|nr:hypothetical protein ALC62_07795 [Cyphomyrmex costatus]
MASLLTVAELKEMLKDAELPTYGLKSEMVTGLLSAGVSLRIVSASEETAERQSDEVLWETTGIMDTVVDPSTSNQRRVSLRTMSTVVTEKEVDLLRRERDVAQREAELLRRELELLRVTPRSESGRLMVRLAELKGSLIFTYSNAAGEPPFP